MNPPILKAPRAQFGLPIVMHFKDQGDPDDQILPSSQSSNPQPDRLASPLIFRPLSESRWGILLLNTPRPQRVRLQSGPTLETTLSKEEAQRIRPLQGETDPIMALIRTLNAQRII